jgi:ATP-dependent Clp protease ATP-binding subunit ClpC
MSAVWSTLAQKVVDNALDEVTLMDAYASTEHQLLGILKEADCNGALVVRHLGGSLEQLRKEVTRQRSRCSNWVDFGVTLTPRALRVLSIAQEQAALLQSPVVGTEHILLGLLYEGAEDGGGLGRRILERYVLERNGITHEAVVEQVRLCLPETGNVSELVCVV